MQHECLKCRIPAQNRNCPHWERNEDYELVKTVKGEKELEVLV